jgi:hypothetical protein
MVESLTQVKAIADIKANRLHVTIAGTIDTRLLEKLYTEIRFCVADLRPGFEVVSDISQCQLLYIAGLPVYKKIIDYLVANRVGEIVRIIHDQYVGCKQIHTFSGRINSYTPLYAYSHEEAKQRLADTVRREGIRLKLRHLVLCYTVPSGNGTAVISDISISGCAVENATIPLAADTELEGSITFSSHATLIGQVEIKAVVVRCQADRFAVRFLGLSDDLKDQLYQRFAYESTLSCPLS